MKAPWKDAPEWATHWAIDESGVAHWFDHEPTLDTSDTTGCDFWIDDGRCEIYRTNCLEPGDDWTKTLEAKPS